MPGPRSAAQRLLLRTLVFAQVFLLVASNGGHLLQLAQMQDEMGAAHRHWLTFDKPDARALLAVADGAIVGTSLMRGGRACFDQIAALTSARS